MAFFLGPEFVTDQSLPPAGDRLTAEMELNRHLRDQLGAVSDGPPPFDMVLSHVRSSVRRLNEMVIFQGLG